VSNPQVTVILPVFNGRASIARAIESVLAQTWSHFELIVVDDASTDGTRDVVETFGDRVRLLTVPHRGVYAARNLGVRHAKGELIAFIDADDRWLPERLASQVPLLTRAEVGLVFGDASHVTESGESRKTSSFRIAPPRRGRPAEALAGCNFVPTITVLVRRRCLNEIGGFSETMALSADYLAWFRIALRHEIDYVDRPVAEYTVREGSLSSDLGRALEARIHLFSGELAQTSDQRERSLLRRLLFNLSLSLFLAGLRGRARQTAHPLWLAWRTAVRVAGLHGASWTAAFAFRHLRVRGRHLFA
jgi:glycosyltransferase involved in cell wall biosynthesis